MNLLLAVNIDETTKKIKSSGPIKIGDNLLFDLVNQLLDSKDEKFLLSDADTVSGKLLDKLTIGEGLTSAIFDNNPHGLALLLESDGKVKVDAAGTLDYLINQLTEGTNVTIAKVDGRLQISVNNIGDDNVQSDWAETRTNDDSFIKNKPNIPSDLSDLSDSNDDLGKVKVDVTDVLDYLENQIQGSLDGSVNITKDTSVLGNPTLIVSANPRIFAIDGDGMASNNLIDKLEAGDNVTIEPSPNQPPDGLTSFKVRISATGGGSSLPATGTMLYYDGTDWVASGHRFGYEENNDIFWWGDYNQENPFVMMQMPDQHGNYSLRLGAGWYGDKMVFGLPVMYSDPSRQMEGDVYFNGNTKKIRYYDGNNWVDIDIPSGSLPAGSLNRTLRHDGNGWVANNDVRHKAGGLIESKAWYGKNNQDLIVNSNNEAVAERRIVQHIWENVTPGSQNYDEAITVHLLKTFLFESNAKYTFRMEIYVKYISGGGLQKIKFGFFSRNDLELHNVSIARLDTTLYSISLNENIANAFSSEFINDSGSYELYEIKGVIKTTGANPLLGSFNIQSVDNNVIGVKNYAYFKAIKETQ